jgi:ER membrane protein complex subunit 4
MSLREIKQRSPAPPPPQWAIDMTSPGIQRPKNTSNVPDPPGFFSARTRTGRQTSNQVAARKASSQEDTETLKLKKAWEVALAPAKQLPMQAIMAYMSGNSLQIFSIMMVWMVSICCRASSGPALTFQAIFESN